MSAAEAAARQSLFREVNERIREAGGTDGVEAVCECANEQCAEPVSLTVEEYEQTRRVPTHFVVKPGHVRADIERVVRTAEDRFEVVEKFGEAGSGAVRLDPRSRRAARAAQ